MARPSVVLAAHDVWAPGGMEQVYTELLRRAAPEVDFTVVSHTLSPELRSLVTWRRVPLITRPLPLKFVLFFILAALQIRRSRADLVHTVGAIVPNRADLVSVQHCHAGVRDRTGSLAPAGGPPLRRLNARVIALLALLAERWCYRPRRVRVLSAASELVREDLDRHYRGVPITVIPNGVDSARFAPSIESRRRLRRELGLSDDDVVALFVGGDWQRKGLALAIDGLAAAQRQTEVPLRLWVVGGGDPRPFIELATRRGAAEAVRFFGRVPAIEPYYQAADLFILPSRYEGFSLVAFEAAACGLPIVATRVGCIGELVSDDAGVIVEGTADSVGSALRRLAADRPWRASLGAAARRRAELYSWGRAEREVVGLYRRLLGPTAPPANQQGREDR
jgi:glycosyltransferase involved in cell wall biosynthesis